ncbi:MAG: Crp/Fnr family transcriptional regulator [Limnobacter sp.]|nr:Crp/Fnr family transcriptional regulator [Limnobacter sp.]
MLSLLKNIRILRDLEDAELQQVMPTIAQKVYKQGDVVIHHNDAATRVMLLCSGQVRVQLLSAQGREMVIRDIHTGEVFGDWSAIDGQSRSASVVAVNDSVIGMMSQADFVKLVTNNPKVALRQLQQLTQQLRLMTNRMTDFVGLKANLRVQRILLDLSEPYGDGLLIKDMPTHQLIALRAFTQREVVAKELNRLLSSGLFVKQPEGMVIPKPADLEVLQTDFN